MISTAITGITHSDLTEAVSKALAEIAPDAEPTEEASSRAAETFLRHLEERSRPLSEVAAGARDEPPPMMIVGRKGSGKSLVSVLAQLEQFVRDRDRFALLVTALMPDEPIPSTPVLEQARRNAAARAAFLDEFPTLSSGEVAELYGSAAQNRAALAQGWRKQGRIFAVPTASGLRFPMFQFQSDGRPKPQVTRILRELERAGVHDWEVALWFASALASLDGMRSVDVLDQEPDRVEAAAAQLSAIPY